MKSSDFLLDQLMQLSRKAPSGRRNVEDVSGRRSLACPEVARGDVNVDVGTEIRKRRAKGESFHEIAVALNRLGARGPYGGRWYEGTVRIAAKGIAK